MEINNVNLFAQANKTSNKQNKVETAPVSFLEYMQQRLNAGEKPMTAESGIEVNELYNAQGVEAIAGRARIKQDFKADVTNFLELVSAKPYINANIGRTEFDSAASAPLNSLTAEQVDYFRKNYDVANMSKDEQAKFFDELASLGVISDNDVRNLGHTVSPSSGDLMGYLAEESEFKDVSSIPETDVKARLEAMISNEQFSYNHVLDRYGKRTASVLELADSHRRVLDVLTRIA